MSKHFVISPEKSELSKEQRDAIFKFETEKLKNGIRGTLQRIKQDESILSEKEDTLKCVTGRVIVKINLDSKNYHTFENGSVIRRERQFNNHNRRETEPVNAVVIDGENITKGAEILIHPNEICDTNKIFGYKNDSPDIGYYSIQREQCFAWRENETWTPLPPFDTALRVFESYKGVIEGILPTQLKDTLFVTSGELKNKAVRTVVAADYVIVFQDIDGKEGRLIRFRPFGDVETCRDPEAIVELPEITQQILNGEMLVGIEIQDAKKLNNG